MQRRDFLTTFGVGAFAAAVHNVDRVLWREPPPNIVTFTVANIEAGDRVGIFEAKTMKPLFIGKADEDFLKLKVLYDSEQDVLVRVRDGKNKVLEWKCVGVIS